MAHVTYDVMLHGRFIATLTFKYSPLWPLDGNELLAYTEKKLPTIKGKDYKIKFHKSNEKNGAYNHRRR